MAKISLKRRQQGSLPKMSPLRLMVSCFALVLVFWYAMLQSNDDISPLLSMAKKNGVDVDEKVVFRAVAPEKKPIVERDGKMRNDVISKIEMGVQVDWMTDPHDWEAVGTNGQQYLHGFYGLTRDGKPAWNPELYTHYDSEPNKDKKKHHAHFSFNKWRSDQLPLSLPRTDTRSPDCKAIAKSGFYHQKKLPNTSVILVAFNEPFSTLFRSIHSILDRTPPELLHEIIVVDDGSDFASFGEELENYIGLLPKTKLHRLKERSGLMAARVYGAKMASGETLTFLDSHIEAMNGWLPPLLERIADDRKIVTMPVIDSINADTWEYTLGGISILGFSWTMGQAAVSRPAPENKTAPMPSPVMAGGLFTIDRKWFFELGGYDPEFKYWGGEEMEISWKIWQCGGRLECIPCSGVGHIFRSPKYWKGSVYHVPSGWINRNRMRAAAVWMDPKHFKLVQDSIPPLPSNMTIGDLSQMKAIKKKLQCKSFQWYLDTQYPELFFPDPKSFKWVGEVRHVDSNNCLDTLARKTQSEPLGVFPCHGQGGNQQLAGTNKDEIRIPGVSWEWCVDGNGGGEHKEVIMYKCHGGKGAQLWEHDEVSGALRVLGFCLTYKGGQRATLEKCENGNRDQFWKITDKRPKEDEKLPSA